MWNTDDQLVEAFTPTLIRISNDSSKHAHHTAMRAIGGGGGETRKSQGRQAVISLSLPFNATHAFKSYSISCTSSKMSIEEKGADIQISLLQ
jgi:stress-induced morphogen